MMGHAARGAPDALTPDELLAALEHEWVGADESVCPGPEYGTSTTGGDWRDQEGTRALGAAETEPLSRNPRIPVANAPRIAPTRILPPDRRSSTAATPPAPCGTAALRAATPTQTCIFGCGLIGVQRSARKGRVGADRAVATTPIPWVTPSSRPARRRRTYGGADTAGRVG